MVTSWLQLCTVTIYNFQHLSISRSATNHIDSSLPLPTTLLSFNYNTSQYQWRWWWVRTPGYRALGFNWRFTNVVQFPMLLFCCRPYQARTYFGLRQRQCSTVKLLYSTNTEACLCLHPNDVHKKNWQLATKPASIQLFVPCHDSFCLKLNWTSLHCTLIKFSLLCTYNSWTLLAKDWHRKRGRLLKHNSQNSSLVTRSGTQKTWCTLCITKWFATFTYILDPMLKCNEMGFDSAIGLQLLLPLHFCRQKTKYSRAAGGAVMILRKIITLQAKVRD